MANNGKLATGCWLLQSRLPQHLEELSLRAHVDGLGNQLTFAVVYEALGDAFDLEEFVNLSSRIEHNRIGNLPLGKERLHFVRLFVGDGGSRVLGP